MDFIYDLFQVISLSMGVGAIIVISKLLTAWKVSAVDAWSVPRANRINSHWLILGVWVSFAGQLADIIFWTVAWALYYIAPSDDITRYAFEFGTIPNIFFRQGTGIAAALCHLYAAEQTPNKTSDKLEVFLHKYPDTESIVNTTVKWVLGTALVLLIIRHVVL